MASCASASIRWLVSTSLPSTLPASAALASPAPMLDATCATVTGPSNGRTEPSGSVTLTISDSRNEKKRGPAALLDTTSKRLQTLCEQLCAGLLSSDSLTSTQRQNATSVGSSAPLETGSSRPLRYW